MSFVAP